MAGKYRDRYSFGLQIVEDGVEVGLGCWNNANGMEYGIRDLSKVGSMEGFVRGCAVPLVRELTSRSELQIAEVCKPLFLGLFIDRTLILPYHASFSVSFFFFFISHSLP